MLFYFGEEADSTSSFSKIFKKEWFSHWLKFPEQEELFSKTESLSNRNDGARFQTYLTKVRPFKITNFDLGEFRFMLFE